MKPTTDALLVKRARIILADLVDLIGWEYEQPGVPPKQRMSGTVAFDHARTWLQREKQSRKMRETATAPERKPRKGA